MGTVNYRYAEFTARAPNSPKPDGPYPVTQKRIFQIGVPTPLGGESIVPSKSSASDPVNEPSQKDAFSTDFYHLGR